MITSRLDSSKPRWRTQWACRQSRLVKYFAFSDLSSRLTLHGWRRRPQSEVIVTLLAMAHMASAPQNLCHRPQVRLYHLPMWVLTGWLVLMGAGGLCYPRRPRTAGALFLAAAGFLFVLWTLGALGDTPPYMPATSAALGLGTLWKFRDPAARAEHVAEWTGQN
jgi:hypothetical protein